MKVAGQVCGFPQGQGQALASRKRRSVPARDDHAARCGAARNPVKPRATPAPPAPSTLGHSGRIYRLCTPLLRSSGNHQVGSLLPAPQHSPRSSGATRPSANPAYKASSQAVDLHTGRDLHSVSTQLHRDSPADAVCAESRCRDSVGRRHLLSRRLKSGAAGGCFRRAPLTSRSRTPAQPAVSWTASASLHCRTPRRGQAAIRRVPSSGTIVLS
jgi:hypothetical protein